MDKAFTKDELEYIVTNLTDVSEICEQTYISADEVSRIKVKVDEVIRMTKKLLSKKVVEDVYTGNELMIHDRELRRVWHIKDRNTDVPTTFDVVEFIRETRKNEKSKNKCPDCNGRGEQTGFPKNQTCTTCEGTGKANKDHKGVN